MIRAAGIDLGGSKSEIQLFDDAWVLREKRRDPTPKDYGALVALLRDQIDWARNIGGANLPLGIGAAGLIDPDGITFTANLPAMGKPLPADVQSGSFAPIVFINDCRAFALSEALLGAGKGYEKVVSLILGTGVGGGVVWKGELVPGPTATGGEFGHIPVSAPAVAEAGLGLRKCGCGQTGCYETYLSGPNLSQIASDIFQKQLSVEELAKNWYRDDRITKLWEIWLKIAADLLKSITLTVDPDVIILGGGLSKIDGIDEKLSHAFAQVQLLDFPVPPIRKAQGGDASGARGAALAAEQASKTERINE